MCNPARKLFPFTHDDTLRSDSIYDTDIEDIDLGYALTANFVESYPYLSARLLYQTQCPPRTNKHLFCKDSESIF